MGSDEQNAAQGAPQDAAVSATPAAHLMAAAQALYPDTSDPTVRLAALMAALDAEGQTLIVNVLEAYSAWDHYLKHRAERLPTSAPLTIPGLQAPPPGEVTEPLEALAAAVTELAGRVAVLEQVVHGPRSST